MRVLLLGGTGAMGTYLTKKLSENEDCFVAVTSRQNLESSQRNVAYIRGNAREDSFLDKVLSTRYDAIVDFMNYGYDEFVARYRKLLQSTDQYVFLSSARVYADSEEPLTETSPRLLDVTTDCEFLATQRYALRKAREENLLLGSSSRNFTIVRPYKTFSGERLQLGAYEKEQWLQRALSGKSVPVRRGLLEKRTTLTFGQDVSAVISKLIGNIKAQGEVVQIASPISLLWSEIVEIYRKVLRELLVGVGVDLFVKEYERNDKLEYLFEGGYQIQYDVLWNRRFNSAKASKVVGEINYTEVQTSLESCLRTFLNGERNFLNASDDFMRIADEMERCND